MNDYFLNGRINVKLVCPNCDTVNDCGVTVLQGIESGCLSIMTDGEIKCWYCQIWIPWELEEETTDRIFENVKKI